MLHATLRSLLAHKVRLMLSALAIILGVAFVAGTLIFTDTLGKTFRDLFASTSSDVTVTKKAAFDAGLIGTSVGGGPPGLPASALSTVLGVPGVRDAAGYQQAEGVYVLDRNGKVLSTGGAPGIGVSWDSNAELSSMHLLEGRGPRTHGEIALDTKTVEKTGYRLGDAVRVLSPGGSVDATLVGVFRFGDTGGLAGASLTAFDAISAERLLGRPGQYSGIAVLTTPGVSQETLKQRLVAALGPGYDVKTRDEQAKSAAAAIQQGLTFINIFLLVFAGIALFVGSFIILNTFSMLVAQRTRELALLRAIGATRRQVTRSVLAEALALGLAGATVGLASGFGIAALLRAVFGRFGLTLDVPLVFAARTVIWSYAVGVLVTLVAAYLPARRAAKVPPVAAMRDDVTVAERSLRRRTISGTILVALGVTGLVASTATADGSNAASLAGLGAWALVVGAIVLSPVLSRPFVRGVGVVLPRIWGRTGHLARENALRNPRRTAATASALMIGLTLVTAFSVLGSSTNRSIDVLIDRTLGADYVVSTAVQQPFSSEVARQIRTTPGVASVTQLRFGIAKLDDHRSILTAADTGSLDRAVRLEFVSGSTSGLHGDAVIVDLPTSKARHWTTGSRIRALFENGSRRTFTVVGVFKRNQAVGSVVLPLPTYEAVGGSNQDRYLYVNLTGGASTATVKKALTRILAPYPVVTLKDQTQFKKEQKSQINQLLLLVNALLVLSILIAVLGIVNTLALSVIERTREIGLLRAVGMARRQLRRMIRLESVVISLYGAVLGIVLGLAFGVTLIRSLRTSGITELAIPAGGLVGFVVLAGIVGVLAAVWPARRAARLDVLTAVTTE